MLPAVGLNLVPIDRMGGVGLRCDQQRCDRTQFHFPHSLKLSLFGFPVRIAPSKSMSSP